MALTALAAFTDSRSTISISFWPAAESFRARSTDRRFREFHDETTETSVADVVNDHAAYGSAESKGTAHRPPSMTAPIPVAVWRAAGHTATRSIRPGSAQRVRGGILHRGQNPVRERCRDSRQHRYHHSGSRHGKHPTAYGGIPVLSFFLSSLFGAGTDNAPDLTPFKYTKQRVLSVKRISPQHVLIDIQISERSKAAFGNGDGTDSKDSSTDGGILDIWHVYVKSPDLQIERPYTPINDVQKDGYIRLLVKRVKGGEVGRYVAALL